MQFLLFQQSKSLLINIFRGKKRNNRIVFWFSLTGTVWCMPFIGLTSSNQIVVQSYGSEQIVTVIGSIVPTETWTHIATSYSVTNGIRLWINGTFKNSSSSFVYYSSNVTNTITIGNKPNAASSCYTKDINMTQFYGKIDELKIFSRELNQTDVSRLANLSLS